MLHFVYCSNTSTRGQTHMLVDPTFPNASQVDSGMHAILSILAMTIRGEEVAPAERYRKLTTGVYECEHFNFGHEFVKPRSFDADYPVLGDDAIGCYGVCDNWQQIIEACPMLRDHPTRQFVVSITPVRKSEQSEDGGWRWHKWGEYIGKQEPSGCEYLFDEPVVEQVYTYHVYELGVTSDRTLRPLGVTDDRQSSD